MSLLVHNYMNNNQIQRFKSYKPSWKLAQKLTNENDTKKAEYYRLNNPDKLKTIQYPIKRVSLGGLPSSL